MVPLRPNTQHFTTPCSLELLLLLLILLFSAEALELGPLFFDAAVVVFGIAFGVGFFVYFPKSRTQSLRRVEVS